MQRRASTTVEHGLELGFKTGTKVGCHHRGGIPQDSAAAGTCRVSQVARGLGDCYLHIFVLVSLLTALTVALVLSWEWVGADSGHWDVPSQQVAARVGTGGIRRDQEATTASDHTATSSCTLVPVK